MGLKSSINIETWVINAYFRRQIDEFHFLYGLFKLGILILRVLTMNPKFIGKWMIFIFSRDIYMPIAYNLEFRSCNLKVWLRHESLSTSKHNGFLGFFSFPLSFVGLAYAFPYSYVLKVFKVYIYGSNSTICRFNTIEDGTLKWR